MMVGDKSIRSAGIKKSAKKRKRESASAAETKIKLKPDVKTNTKLEPNMETIMYASTETKIKLEPNMERFKLEPHEAARQPAPAVASPPPHKRHKNGQKKTEVPKNWTEGLDLEVIGARFPILKNDELVQKFLNVTMTNNQKGRIRQVLRDNLKDTSDSLLPDVIHGKIQSILKSSEHLTDTDLRKIRILYNMLKTAIVSEQTALEKKLSDKKSSDIRKKLKNFMKLMMDTGKDKVNAIKEKSEVKTEKKEQLVKKAKGQKRYVVFLGNLPLDVNKEMIMNHFSEMNENILNIRLPKLKEDQKSAFAYVELRNEPTYELALSKHHSMMGKKRINVLYTMQKSSKLTRAEAKSKSAKLLALQRSGKLIGSTSLNKKRSQRRLKQKMALAQQERENNLTL